MPIISADNTIKYFGVLSWANLLDWTITFCLGGILALTALQLGGVRPETQLLIQPLYIVLMALHGLYYAVSEKDSQKLNTLPFFFIPFLIWAFTSVCFLTPTPWRGSYELSYFFTAFLFGWVAVNNVHKRLQLWTLIIIGLIPLAWGVFVGYDQFFQNQTRMVDVSLGYPIELNVQYLGKATGLFADSGSFAAFLLIPLPCFIVAAFVPRLPGILKVLSFYTALILAVGITLAQTYWAVFSMVVLMVILPWFCFEKKRPRYLFSFLGIGAVVVFFLLMYSLNPRFERGVMEALTPEGEGVRLVLWNEVIHNVLQSPIFGSGAGSFSLMVEKSTRLALPGLPLTPHNDFMLILNGYGLVGGCLFFLPLAYVFFKAIRAWKKEPFRMKYRGEDIMTMRKFLLSLAICAAVALIICGCVHFLIYVPALLLYGVLIFSILVKLISPRGFRLPDFRFFGLFYFLICSCVGALFWSHASLVTESHGLELQARQQLEALVERGIGVSGNFELVDQVIMNFEDALILDEGNADAWIGLSMAICQLHYRDPSDFERTGERAVEAVTRAYELCPEYWLASSQLGVALALSGRIEAARIALERGVGLAPNSSNAHYYYAAFLSSEPAMREDAIKQVRRALEIAPNNGVARRLEQKLLIL